MDELNENKGLEGREHRELHEIHEDFEDARRRYERASADLIRFYSEFRDATKAGKTWKEPVGAA